MGSTFVARRAGTYAATTATPRRINVTKAKVMGSCGLDAKEHGLQEPREPERRHNSESNADGGGK